MKILNKKNIIINQENEEVGGEWACLLACVGTCLVTNGVGAALGQFFAMA